MIYRYLAATLALLLATDLPATGLPDLGEASQATVSPQQERELGLRIMAEIRADPSYLDDAEVAGYLTGLGTRLLLNSSESRPDQEFEFFAVKDPMINAFALPGGFMGFNTGLILAAQSESELAGVMAHEIAHVTQKHLARMIAGQKYAFLSSLGAVALAVLASRSNPQAAQAVLIGSQARQIQSQLDFTREHEKEADRIGLNILVSAGLDPRGMSGFFERLQRAGRFRESSAPSYLRTHPITHERIADIDSRTQSLPYRQIPDSLDFQLVRAKLRAAMDTPGNAVEFFDSALREKRYRNEAVERYGLINALLRDRKFMRADKELMRLYENLQSSVDDALQNRSPALIAHSTYRVPLSSDTIEALAERARLALGEVEAHGIFSGAPPDSVQPDADGVLENHRLGATIHITRKPALPSPMIETLAAKVKLALGETAEALDLYEAALQIYPQHRALVYDYAETLLHRKDPAAALRFVNQQLQFLPDDTRLYRLQALCHGALGNTLMQHRAQAEIHVRQGDIPAAIEQLQIALKDEDGDFYQKSGAEARLRELRTLADAKKNE